MNIYQEMAKTLIRIPKEMVIAFATEVAKKHAIEDLTKDIKNKTFNNEVILKNASNPTFAIQMANAILEDAKNVPNIEAIKLFFQTYNTAYVSETKQLIEKM